jgi:hypothetical protein
VELQQIVVCYPQLHDRMLPRSQVDPKLHEGERRNWAITAVAQGSRLSI